MCSLAGGTYLYVRRFPSYLKYHIDLNIAQGFFVENNVKKWGGFIIRVLLYFDPGGTVACTRAERMRTLETKGLK